MLLKEGGLKGDVLLVYLTKHVLVNNGTELHRQHGQRDWRASFEQVFIGGAVPYDRMVELVKAVNHGYAATSTAQDMVVQLARALGADHAPLEKYYKHCASVQRDLNAQFEDDLDYLDLFGDKARGKIFEEGRTMACISDCLRLHPTLMEATWNVAHASRDSEQLFTRAAGDIDRFNVMLNSDGRVLGLYSLRCSVAPSAVVHTTPSLVSGEHVVASSVQLSTQHQVWFAMDMFAQAHEIAETPPRFAYGRRERAPPAAVAAARRQDVRELHRRLPLAGALQG